MAPVFIFADQVQRMVRSGKTEIEVVEGARISSAAADLIKAHDIRVKTIAPDSVPEDKQAERSPQTTTATDAKPQRSVEKSATPAVQKTPAELSEEELEDIVNRVLERFNHLKGRSNRPKSSAKNEQASSKESTPAPDDDLIICRCEEITRAEIKAAIRNGMQTLNGIKRVTRAGMGLCQGQTCQRLVAHILTQELGLKPGTIDPTTARGPVRPLRLAVFAND